MTNARAGTATFSSLAFDKAGSYTLTASAGSLTSAASSSFTISAGTASKLVWGTQPSNGNHTSKITPSPTVLIEDAAGNVVNSNATVTLAIASGPSSATITGGSVAASNGTATFSQLKLSAAGTYTLTASTASGLASPPSGQFTLS